MKISMEEERGVMSAMRRRGGRAAAPLGGAGFARVVSAGRPAHRADPTPGRGGTACRNPAGPWRPAPLHTHFERVYDLCHPHPIRYRRDATAVVTEVFTRKYCDPHALRDEKVEATEVVQFAWEGTVREVDACDECRKEHEARYEPLVDYSRPVKKRRVTKKKGDDAASAETAETADAAAE